MEVRDRILAKAEELLLDYGVRSVTMDDLASELGMSKKTLYQFFADKDELVIEVVKMHTARSKEDCNCVRAQGHDAIHESLLTMEKVMTDLRNMNPIVLSELSKYHPKAFGVFLEYKKNYLLQFLRDNIQRGINEKLYRNDIDVEVFSLFRLEAILIPFNVKVFPPAEFNFISIVRQVAETFIYGIVTLEGYKKIETYKNNFNKTS